MEGRTWAQTDCRGHCGETLVEARPHILLAGINRGKQPRGGPAFRVPSLLAFPVCAADIGPGRLAVDEPLANRVRSGRKQP
jgi:hypothetical protein